MDPVELADKLFALKEEVLADCLPDVRESVASMYGEPLTDETIVRVEDQLGLKLPESYLELMRVQNGGSFRSRWYGMNDEDYTDFDDLYPVEQQLDGEHISSYMISEWGYPSPSYYFGGDGHTALLLDYRNLQPGQEPPVLYVDLERGPEVYEKKLFDSFGEFIRFVADSHPRDA